MKKFSFIPLVILTLCSGFFSCSDDDDDIDPNAEKNEALAPAIKQYIDNTVVITYRELADATIELYEAIADLRSDKTQANITAATEKWIASRKYWEQSEAFLFGAAADFGIDPHIDTWPLDEAAFKAEMNNAAHIASMDDEDGDIWVGEHLGPSLLGFHGIEYILFSDGSPRSNPASITDNQMIYALAVAGDLRNQCIRLEAAWAGYDNVSAAKQELIDEKELVISLSHSELSYGENMINAGESGSTYRSVSRAASDIITGCIDICDEVGSVKIGTAHSKADVNYIESPYSYNSLVDFADNIRSIENAYIGGIEGKRGKSISDYIKSVDSDADAAVKAGIANAIAKINAIPAPFAKNYAAEEAATAMEACDELLSALTKVKSIVEQ